MAWIDDEIAARGGSVPFREFMDLALYHPDHGYYSSGEPRYGRDGDFLTAPTSSRWYARVLGHLLRRLSHRLGPLQLADVGSGDGSLVADLAADPAVPASVLGAIASVERSAGLRALQHERLLEARDRVSVVATLDEVRGRGLATLVHASELYDAAPVARVVRREGELRELWVAAGEDGLEWLERPAAPELHTYLDSHRVALRDGQIAEVNLAARGAHLDLLAWAGDPAVTVALDYGYEASRLYHVRGRAGGSLSTFHRHRLGRDPLRCPGTVDITAHVNWDDLRAAAADAGWTEVGLWPLAEFLVRAGVEEVASDLALGPEAELEAAVYAERQELKRLLDPEGMGADLKVLVQASSGAAEAAAEALCALSAGGAGVTMR